MSMDQIRDAIMSGDRSQETYEALEIPTTYRGATVHKDEVGMFEGMASRDKDPRKSLHIDDVDLPELAPGEALVAVMASAINYNTVWTSIFALPVIRQKTLLVFGEDDPIIPMINGRIFETLLPRATRFSITEHATYVRGMFKDTSAAIQYRAAVARASRVLARVRPHLHDGDVVLVGHGHTSRILATVWLRTSPRLAAQLTLDASRLAVLGHHREDPCIISWNC